MKPILVGIVGGSGSGKTTLACGLAALTEPYGRRIISQDHYYRGVPAGQDAGAVNFDEPVALDLDLLASHLLDAKRGLDFQMPQYDFSTHRRSELTERVAPAGERLLRRVVRDTAERGREAEDIIRQFEQQVEPMYQLHILPTRQHADVVINLPHPDDHLYCTQVIEMWGRVEQLLKVRGFLPDQR